MTIQVSVHTYFGFVSMTGDRFRFPLSGVSSDGLSVRGAHIKFSLRRPLTYVKTFDLNIKYYTMCSFYSSCNFVA